MNLDQNPAAFLDTAASFLDDPKPAGDGGGSQSSIDDLINADSKSTIIQNALRINGYLDKMSQSFGSGPHNSQLQTFFTETDKFNHNTLPPNALHAGYTFITRPKLCLHDVSISKQSEFIALDTDNYNSIQYAIRCLLDSKFSKNGGGNKCALVDQRSPFLTPVMNGLIGISGYPDPIVETLTTDAGFHSEDQTFVSGYNQMNKTYDLTLDFRDPQLGPVMAIMYYWLLYMGYLSKGMMPAYLEDIVQRRLNYTVSIYRFVVDPTKRYIVHYSKATGCYPKSVPMGAMFNYSDSDKFVRAAGNFSIPFVANKIEYNKPEILGEFNYLVERYAGKDFKYQHNLPLSVSNNYAGIPYIDTGIDFAGKSPIELVFKSPTTFNTDLAMSLDTKTSQALDDADLPPDFDLPAAPPSFLSGIGSQNIMQA